MKTKTKRLLAMLLAVTMLSSMATNTVTASAVTSVAPRAYAPQEDSDSSDGETVQNSGDIFSDIGFKLEDTTDITDIVETPLRARSYTSGDFDELYTLGTDGATLFGNGENAKIQSDEDKLLNGDSKSTPLPADASAIVKTVEGDFGGIGRENGVASLFSSGGDLILQITDPADDSFKAEPILVCKDWDKALNNSDTVNAEAADLARINCSAVVAGNFNSDDRDDLAVAYAPLSLDDDGNIVYGNIVIKTYTTKTPRWNRGEDAVGWALDGTWTNSETLEAEVFVDSTKTVTSGVDFDRVCLSDSKQSETKTVMPNMLSLAAGPLYEGELNRNRDFLLITTGYFSTYQLVDSSSYSSISVSEKGYLEAATSKLRVFNPDSNDENKIEELVEYDTQLFRAGVAVDYICNDDIDAGQGAEFNAEARKRMTPYVLIGGTDYDSSTSWYRSGVMLGSRVTVVNCVNTLKILNWYDKEYDEDNQSISVNSEGYKLYDSTKYTGATADNYGFGIYDNGYEAKERYISSRFNFIPSLDSNVSAVAQVIPTAGVLFEQADSVNADVSEEEMGNLKDDPYGRCTYIFSDTTQFFFFPTVPNISVVGQEIVNVKTCNPITGGILARETGIFLEKCGLRTSNDSIYFSHSYLVNNSNVWLYNGKAGRMNAKNGEVYYAGNSNGISKEALEIAHFQLYYSEAVQTINAVVNHVNESNNLCSFIENNTFNESNYVSFREDLDVSTTVKVLEEGERSYALPNTDIDGYSFVYVGQETMFSDPEVMAVLAAPPCFKDLALLDGGGTMQNCSTDFTLSRETETGLESATTISLGAFISIETEITAPITGTTLAETAFESEFSTATTGSYSQSKTIEYSVSYSTKGLYDSVVMYCVPYDVYYYRAYKEGYDGYTMMSYRVPKQPVTQVLSLDEYNSVATRYGIDSIEIDSTPGDPSSYTSNNYSELLFTSNSVKDSDAENDYFAVGREGGSEIGAAISVGSSDSVSFSQEVSFSVKAGAGLMGVVAGVSAGFSSAVTTSTVESKSTAYSCAVFALPEGAPRDYDFSWQMRVYKLTGTNPSGSKTEYPLVTYHLVDVKQPPLLPSNLRVTGTTDTSISLAWDINDDNAMYELVRSGNGATATITDISGDSYTDTGLEKNVVYSYSIRSVKGSSTSIDSLPIKAYTHRMLTASVSAFVTNTGEYSDTAVNSRLGDRVNMIVVDDNTEAALISYVWEKKNTITGNWDRFEWDSFDYKTGKFTFDGMLFDNYGTYRCKVRRTSGEIEETVYSNELTLSFSGKMKMPLFLEAKSIYNDDVIYGNEAMSFNMLFDGALTVCDEEYDELELSLSLDGNPLNFSLTLPKDKENPIRITLGGASATQTISLSELKLNVRRFIIDLPEDMTGVLEMSAVALPTCTNYYEGKYSASCYVNKYSDGADIPEAKTMIKLTLKADNGDIRANGVNNTTCDVPYGTTVKLHAIPNEGYTIAQQTNVLKAPGATETDNDYSAVYYTNAQGNKVYAEELGDGYFQFVGLTAKNSLEINADFEKSAIDCVLNADSDDENAGFTLGGSVGDAEVLSVTGAENMTLSQIIPIDEPVLTLTIEPNENSRITSWSYEEFGTGEIIDLLAIATSEEGTNRLTAACQLGLENKTNIEIRATASTIDFEKLALRVSDTNGDVEGGLNGTIGYSAVHTDVYSDDLNLDIVREKDGITDGEFDIYGENTSVTLTAAPDYGYVVYEWIVDGEKQESNGQTLTIDALTDATSVSVSFVKTDEESYPIYFTADEIGSIKATVGINDVSAQSGSNFKKGTTLTLSAVSTPGNEFVRWNKNGVEFSTEAEIAYVISNQASFTAEFKQSIYSITCGSNVTASTATAIYDSEVTFTAMIRDDSAIVGWLIDGERVGLDALSPYTLTLKITDNVTVEAIYGNGEIVTTTEPVVTTAPEVTTVPTVTTTEPEVTTVPTASTTVPAATTTEPTVTTAPEVTTVPAVTTAPEVTTVPAVTTAPEVTTVPAVTTAPEVTTVPAVTTAPEVTTVPTVTTAPEVTTVPTVTTAPEVTTVPTVTTAPEVTTVPSETTTEPIVTTEPEVIPFLLGDPSGDGKVNSFDALFILKYCAEAYTDCTEYQLAACDVSGDGIITAYDALMVLQYEANIIVDFSA